MTHFVLRLVVSAVLAIGVVLLAIFVRHGLATLSGHNDTVKLNRFSSIKPPPRTPRTHVQLFVCDLALSCLIAFVLVMMLEDRQPDGPQSPVRIVHAVPQQR